jgi:hypothetical protein
MPKFLSLEEIILLLEQDEEGRWIATVVNVAGVVGVYGHSPEDAQKRAIDHVLAHWADKHADDYFFTCFAVKP